MPLIGQQILIKKMNPKSKLKGLESNNSEVKWPTP
jgi:hypothetical protein